MIKNGDNKLIRKKKINKIQTYLDPISQGDDLKVSVKLTDPMKAKLNQWGFSHPPVDGETLLPTVRGPATRFNADGRWQIHKDLPKEDRYIRTISWSWTDWQGNHYEDFKDIHRQCYPRTLISPPGEEIAYIEVAGEAYLVSRAFKNTVAEHKAIRSAANVLLEMCGECEFIQANLAKFPPMKIKRVTWKFLPPGKSPWSTLHAHLSAHLKASPSTLKVIFDRQKTIMSYKPDDMYVGEGGFGDYIAYHFKAKGFVVLECVRKGNAIYVFDKNWASFAQLSKGDIIQNGLHKARIVHTDGWKDRLDKLFKLGKAA
ncbi:hypothetical protein [Paracoccus sp. R86501]|uniref:hypothetical protein n=1 Tax=Paracoccus sp. R86501 TaxID=3101711 RepID=UPI00366C12A5